MILGLMLMVVVRFQSCADSFGVALGDSNGMEEGGAVGILVALLFLVGAAFALAFPLVSLASFTLADILGLAGGSTTPFKDLTMTIERAASAESSSYSSPKYSCGSSGTASGSK